MEKIKNILLSFLAAFLIVVPFGNAEVNAKEKVKVYVFEAGGCPYCEAEITYLEGLSSYGEKFEIVRKQLYIDHEKWEPGKDYNLGEEVAKLFKENGFTNAVTTGTPMVVISNLYAETTYSTELESIINEAYDKGDADVVGCLENGGSNCWKEPDSDGSEVFAAVISILALVGLVALVVVTRTQVSDEEEDDILLNESKEDEKSDDEVVVKKLETKPSKKVSKIDSEVKSEVKKTTRKSTSKSTNKSRKK